DRGNGAPVAPRPVPPQAQQVLPPRIAGADRRAPRGSVGALSDQDLNRSAVRCVLLHPHPDRGGNQHNNVIAALYAVLDDAVRFDFASSDLAVATGQVREQLEAGPAWLVGYSFGGGVAALVDDPGVLGWCLIAPALAMVEPVIGADPRPKHILAAD